MLNPFKIRRVGCERKNYYYVVILVPTQTTTVNKSGWILTAIELESLSVTKI